MAEFNTTLPSIRQVQNFIKDKQQVEIKLITTDSFTGQIQWQDANCLCMADATQQPVLISREAIVYIKLIG